MSTNCKGCFLLWCITWLACTTIQAQLMQCERGVVTFKSDAPLEIIQARSDQLRGVLDLHSRNFAFSVELRSFEGFNNPLQREHFNENYLESDRYPTATFVGKIIEPIRGLSDGNYTWRAKGLLTVHGISQERIIKNTVRIEAGVLYIESLFTVAVADHDIAIPRIVQQKIATAIRVQVSASFRSPDQ